MKSSIVQKDTFILKYRLKTIQQKIDLYYNLYSLLSDIILCFGLAFDLELIMLTILHLYCRSDTVFTYSESAAISAQFITFNNLLD